MGDNDSSTAEKAFSDAFGLGDVLMREAGLSAYAFISHIGEDQEVLAARGKWLNVEHARRMKYMVTSKAPMAAMWKNGELLAAAAGVETVGIIKTPIYTREEKGSGWIGGARDSEWDVSLSKFPSQLDGLISSMLLQAILRPSISLKSILRFHPLSKVPPTSESYAEALKTTPSHKMRESNIADGRNAFYCPDLTGPKHVHILTDKAVKGGGVCFVLGEESELSARSLRKSIIAGCKAPEAIVEPDWGAIYWIETERPENGCQHFGFMVEPQDKPFDLKAVLTL